MTRLRRKSTENITMDTTTDARAAGVESPRIDPRFSELEQA
jgi:hypothetical protein